MRRILNLGFFIINDDYVSLLRKLPFADEVDFDNINERTYLPIISMDMSPIEVRNLVGAAVSNASPKDGDIILVSGSHDVVAYVVDLVKNNAMSVVFLVPVGKSIDGRFCLNGLREIVLDSHYEEGIFVRGDTSSQRHSMSRGGKSHGSGLRKEGVRSV